MKKVLYSVLALAGLLTLSCAKEIDAPNAESAQENLVPLTLTASYDVATKVTYEGLKTFGWEANDSIKVRCVSGDNKEDGWYALGAKAAGATAQFVGDVPDTYTPRDYAFYPGFKQNITGTTSAPAVRLPVTYYLDEVDASSNPIAPHIDPSNCTKVYVSSANPLQFLPSVGSLQEGGSFKFQAAYGVLNIQMTDLDDAASGLRLVGTADAYMGNYLMLDKTDLCYKIGAKYVSPSSGSTLSTTYIQYWFYPKADHTASIYLPVPVGTLPAGCSIDIVDEKGTVLYKQTFAKDVEVQRGKITTLAPFKAKYDWTLVGTGKFIDAFLWESFGFTDPVDVKIETSGNGNYRLENPYGVAAQTYKYEIPATATGPDAYLDFSVVPVGSSLHSVTTTKKGLVDFSDYYTGLVSAEYGVDPYIAHPGGWSSLRNESNFAHNIVTKFAADGETPAVVQLAPIYVWLTDPATGSGSWTNYAGWMGGGFAGPSYAKNNLIQILFPGQTELTDLQANVSFVEITDPTPAQATAKVKVVMGKDIASLSMVIAANANDAVTALTSGTDVVTTATASGDFSVKLPANAPSGDYYVYSIVQVGSGINPELSNIIVSPVFAYSNEGEYESLGDAQFIDAYSWKIAGFKEGTPVSVEVKKSTVSENKYLVVDPYGAAIKAFSYTPAGTVAGPDKELILTVSDEGYVDWDAEFRTGIFNPGFNSSKGTEMTITPPYWYASNYPQYYADFGRGNNYVARYAADGKTPATIVLSPIYEGVDGNTWNPNDRESNPIQIVLPGSSPVDLNSLVSFKEMKDESADQPIATVTLYLGDSFESADIVIAADAKAAAAAFAGGQAKTATESGDVDVNLPANAPSGKYTVFAKLAVKIGINPLCGKTVTSDPFQYNNPNEDRGIKIEDVVGDYVAAAVLYNGSYSKYDLEFSLAVNTGDPTMGDVIITHFGDAAIGGAPDYEVYGWLDSKTGELTIPVNQPMWDFGASYDGGLHNPESTDTAIVLLYGDDKSLRVENAEFLRVMLYEKGTTTIKQGYYYWYGNTTDYHLVFKPVVTSSSTAAAPKVNGQKTVSEKSFQVFSEKCHVASGKVANAPAAR